MVPTPSNRRSRLLTCSQTRDSTATYLHLHASHHADLIEEFTRPSTSKLPDEEIYVPPQHQPLNPEDEDDVVPDQHAAFGIQRATQGKKEASWKDLGLDELMRRAPGEGAGTSAGAGIGMCTWNICAVLELC